MNRRFAILAFAASSCVLAGCGGSGSAEPVDMPFTRIDAFWPTLDLKQTYSIRNDTEWQATWVVHAPMTLPATPRPPIDFTKNMVLGVSQGTGPSGCYGLAIERVVEDDLAIRVDYRQTSGPIEAICTMSIVPLTDFVVVKRSDKPTSFVRLGT